jgi:hypothetical protein
MKVKIIKCSKSTFWYVNRIGEIHVVTNAIKYPNNAGKGFEVFVDGGRKFIDVEDAEIVFEDFN